MTKTNRSRLKNILSKDLGLWIGWRKDIENGSEESEAIAGILWNHVGDGTVKVEEQKI